MQHPARQSTNPLNQISAQPMQWLDSTDASSGGLQQQHPSSSANRRQPVAHPINGIRRTQLQIQKPIQSPPHGQQRSTSSSHPSSKVTPPSNPTAASVVARSKQIQPPWRSEYAIHSKVRTHLAPSSGAWPTPVPRTDRRAQIQALAIRPNSNKSGASDQGGPHCSTPKYQKKTGDSMFQ
ncbi:hypothetical protein ACLOJK_034382 [Asimina triloba]